MEMKKPSMSEGDLENKLMTDSKEIMQQPQITKVDPAQETDKVQSEGIIAQITPDDLDRERDKKRKQPGTVPVKLVSVMEMKDSERKSTMSEGDCVSIENELMKDLKEEDMTESEVIPPYNSQNMELPGNDSVIEEGSNKIRNTEVNTELGVKKVFTSNATTDIKEKDPSLSATAGWNEAMGLSATAGSDCEASMETELDGSLRFYILDAYEEAFGASMGTIYLFGKVKMGDTYKSCCVVVTNIQRCVYAIPNDSIFPSHELIMLEQEVKDSRLSPESFHGKLHEMASKLENEIADKFHQLNVTKFSMAPVKINCASERPDMPAGQQYVLKINYPFKDCPLPKDLKGESFRALLGSQTSALEHFIRKRKIMVPSWLKISNFSTCPPSERVSWCKFEITVDYPKDITVLVSEEKVVHPPAVVTSINLKTVVNEKQNISEIVSASVLCFHNAKIDVPMPAPERKRSGILSHFTVVRNPEGTNYPIGWEKEVADRNSKSGCVLSTQNSESALLNQLFLELNKLDSDVLVGHNISSFDLDDLLQRAQACKVQSSMWSKVGRLKRSFMPKLEGNSNFGSGATLGLLSCIAGRLLCDTNLCSRDLLKQVGYSLTDLSKTQLNWDRKEIAPSDIPKMFQSTKTLVELIECGETDAWLSMKLMFHLSVLPVCLTEAPYLPEDHFMEIDSPETDDPMETDPPHQDVHPHEAFQDQLKLTHVCLIQENLIESLLGSDVLDMARKLPALHGYFASSNGIVNSLVWQTSFSVGLLCAQSWRESLGPIRDQKDHLLCWDYVATDLVSAEDIRSGYEEEYKTFSAEHLFHSVKNAALIRNPQARVNHKCFGFNVRAAIDHMEKSGVPPREGNNPTFDCNLPTFPFLRFNDRISRGMGFLKIDCLEEALYYLQNIPIGADVVCFSNLFECGLNIYYGPGKGKVTFEGYHAVIIESVMKYRDDFVAVCKMSNGTHVGDAGYLYVSLTTRYLLVQLNDVTQKSFVRSTLKPESLLSNFVGLVMDKKKTKYYG